MTRRTLAISTASSALSLAVFDGESLAAHDHRIIGRGHAEALVPAIMALLAGHAPPDAVLVDVGPGSFTGIRIGIAAARALGLAWHVPVNGFCGLALVAARAFAERPGLAQVGSVLDGGRGQLICSAFGADLVVGPMRPIAAGDLPAGLTLAGAAAAGLAADIVHTGLPDCAFALHLPPAVRDNPPDARYLRPPDAILPL